MDANKLLIYVDMDGVLCNYEKAFVERIIANPKNQVPQSDYGFFANLEEIPGAIDAIKLIAQHHDVWILSRPSFKNPLSYTEKRVWIEKHLDMSWVEKLILSPNKALNIGDILIDDRPWEHFKGKQILFGSAEFPTWAEVLLYLAN